MPVTRRRRRVRVVAGDGVGDGALRGAGPGQLRGDVTATELGGGEPVAVVEVRAGDGERGEVRDWSVRIRRRKAVVEVRGWWLRGESLMSPSMPQEYLPCRN
nr:hypothetical protein [Corynebacterium sp. CNJ-954]